MREREIKFRGNRIDNNEMVKGSLLIEKIEKPTLKIDPIGEYKELEEITSYSICVDGGTKDGKVWCEVDPATVGQYTGLKDANGVEIYEGDILNILDPLKETPIQYVVGFYYGCFSVCENGEPKNGTQTLLSLHFEYKTITAIGNIHENPNLLLFPILLHASSHERDRNTLSKQLKLKATIKR